jgi:hypothetical protein
MLGTRCLTERAYSGRRHFLFRLGGLVRVPRFFRHDLKSNFGQHRQNRLLDDRVRREEQGVEFDRATLPRYPDPLHALTIFIRFHNFCLRQEVIEMVVGRQRDLVLLQVATGCRERARDDYSSAVARDVDGRTGGIDPRLPPEIKSLRARMNWLTLLSGRFSIQSGAACSTLC